jgi:hypothetical protein
VQCRKVLSARIKQAQIQYAYLAAAGAAATGAGVSFFTGTFGTNFGLKPTLLGPSDSLFTCDASALVLLLWPFDEPSPPVSPVSHAGSTLAFPLLGADISLRFCKADAPNCGGPVVFLVRIML